MSTKRKDAKMSATAKLADYRQDAMPTTFKARIKRNKKSLTVRMPSSFKDKRLEASYSNNQLTISEVESGGVKVGTTTWGEKQYNQAVFAAAKYVPDMPLLAETLEVKWSNSSKSMTIDLKAFSKPKNKMRVYRKRKGKVIHITPTDRVASPMSKRRAANCVQYLNKFLASKEGAGYKAQTDKGKIRLIMSDIIE